MKKELKIPAKLLWILPVTLVIASLSVYLYIYSMGTFAYLSGQDPDETARIQSSKVWTVMQENSIDAALIDYKQEYLSSDRYPYGYRPPSLEWYVRKNNDRYRIYKLGNKLLDAQYSNPYKDLNEGKLVPVKYVSNQTPIIQIVFESPFGSETSDVEVKNITAGDILKGYFDYSSTKNKYTQKHLTDNDKIYILYLWGALSVLLIIPLYIKIKLT